MNALYIQLGTETPEGVIEIHKDELYANWKLAIQGEKPFPIEPLK